MKTKKKFTIFTVEDNLLFALILKHNLSSNIEFFIINYATGEECINNLHLNPDLIILDYHLLEMNGLDTLLKIREISIELPVVVLTHEKDNSLLEQFYSLGITGLIDKNNDPMANLQPLIDGIYEKTISFVK